MIDQNQYRRELAQDARDSRRASIAELTSVVYALKETTDHSLRDQMKVVIKGLLDSLYPDSQGLSKPPQKQIIPDEIFESLMSKEVIPIDEHIDQACGEDISYSWDALIERKFYVGAKLARRKWDNKFNQEYITWDISRGFTKHYKTASLDGFYKNVEHTYRASEEDTKALDWYIL